MKKIVIMFLLMTFSVAFGQSDNPYVYDEPEEMSTLADGDNPASPGDPKLAPIDDYIPVLLIVAIVFTFAYAKRKNAVAE
ncbi:hypothetical protein [Chryseobacterium sp. RLHN22]|uniref:hypothetical protein n=1 Tax=Chryseobacterium sp. RLHN22 TaxID=3437885 RepID=UPI003D9AD0C4